MRSIVLISCDQIVADLSPIWNCSQNGDEVDYAAANPIERGRMWAKVSETAVRPKFMDEATELLRGVMDAGFDICLLCHIEPDRSVILTENMPDWLRAVRITHVKNQDIIGTLEYAGIDRPHAALVSDQHTLSALRGRCDRVAVINTTRRWRSMLATEDQITVLDDPLDFIEIIGKAGRQETLVDMIDALGAENERE